MSGAISEYLPVAAGIILTPASAIAIIVLCVIGAAKSRGTIFLLGWYVGVFASMLLVVTVGQNLTGSSEEPSTLSGFIRLVLALVFFWIAWSSWKDRPAKDEVVEQPAWVTGLENMSLVAVFGLGLVANIISFKNIPLIVSAAMIIADNVSSWGEGIFEALIFMFIASLGVLIPWLVTVLGGDKVMPVLEEMRDWLYRYSSVIAAVIFFVLGMSTLGGAIEILG